MNRFILFLVLLLSSGYVLAQEQSSYIDARPNMYKRRVVIGPKYSDKTDNRNVLEQSDFTRENTEYVIKYNFILQENIRIPANCTLTFEGGSIEGAGKFKNTIEGKNTYINAGNQPIFDDISLVGNCYGSDEYTYNICWFKGDSFSDRINLL